jgi:hypothetical protein
MTVSAYVHADQQHDQHVPAHRGEIGARGPDEKHQGDNGDADRRAYPEVDQRGFPAVERYELHGIGCSPGN